MLLTLVLLSFSPSALAASPTPSTVVKKTSFKEALSLQFTITEDYTMKLDGVIELTNATGKDISLTEYSMDLPYFLLKDTTIGNISPNAFLVDMYSQNGSILFTFKSLYTKPVVIGKDGKIVFTFSARVDRPYNDFGGLRTLAFPFVLSSEQRNVIITVVLHPSLTVLSAPQSPAALISRHVYSVTDSNGKGFLFKINDTPMTFSISGNTEISLPLSAESTSCSPINMQTCVGCKRILWNSATGEVTAQKQEDATTVAATYTRDITPHCNTSSQRIAGYILLPEQRQFYPAQWSQTEQGITDLTMNIPAQLFNDPKGYLAVPMLPCKDEADCIVTVEKLKAFAATVTNDSAGDLKQTTRNAQQNDIAVSTYNKGRQSYIAVENLTDTFLSVQQPAIDSPEPLIIEAHSGFIIPPKTILSLPMNSLKPVQSNNNALPATVLINKHSYPITIVRTSIFLLTIVGILGYIFAVALSLTLVSGMVIILYNKHAQKKNPAVPAPLHKS